MFGNTSSRRAAALALVLATALNGCAFIMQGTHEEVSFTTEPPGASFSVAGITAETPATLVIPKSDYTVRFDRVGYHPAEFELTRETGGWFYLSLVMGVITSSVDILSGAWQVFHTNVVHVAMRPLKDTPVEGKSVAFRSEPEGAEVLIGGTLHGRTPLDMKPIWTPVEKEKRVTFRLPGYRTAALPLAREADALKAALEPVPFAVRTRIVSEPPGAVVRIEGRPAGTTPMFADVSWIPGAPAKKVEFVMKGYHPAELSLEGPGRREIEARLREVVETIPLEIRTLPPGVRIEVDGVAAGNAPAKLPLAWSVSVTKHRLRFTFPGYAPLEREVTRPEAAAPLEIRLRPLLPK